VNPVLLDQHNLIYHHRWKKNGAEYDLKTTTTTTTKSKNKQWLNKKVIYLFEVSTSCLSIALSQPEVYLIQPLHHGTDDIRWNVKQKKVERKIAALQNMEK